MRKLGIAILTVAVLLAFFGFGLIVQRFFVGQITQCQAAIVDQFVAASGPRAAAQEARDRAAAVKDRAEADMGKVLLDETASDKDKRAAFIAWTQAGEALAEASEHLVAVKAANPLPPPPTETCGNAP